jgi:hypothetical protein
MNSPGGVPPSLSWLEVYWNDRVTSGQTAQNRLNKGLSRKIVTTKDLASFQDVKERSSCAQHFLNQALLKIYSSERISYAKLTCSNDETSTIKGLTRENGRFLKSS